MTEVLKHFEFLYGIDSTFAIIVLIIFVLYVMFGQSFKKRIDFNMRPKTNKLKEALESQVLDEKDKFILEQQLAKEYFRAATGIMAEKEFRNAICDLYKKTKGELGFRHFKWAMDHLEFRDLKIYTKITKWQYLYFYGNWFLSIFLFILSAIMAYVFILSVFSSSLATMQLSSGFQAIVGFGVGILALTETFSVRSARYIQEYLETENIEEVKETA